MVLMKNAQLEKMGLSCFRRLARACKATHDIRFASHAAALGHQLRKSPLCSMGIDDY